MSKNDSDAQEASRLLVNAALERLRKMLGAGRVGRRSVQRLVIERPGSMSLPTDYSYDWWLASTLVLMDLEKSPVYLQFEKAVKGDSLLGKRMDTMIGTSVGRRLITCQDFAQLLLFKLLSGCSDNVEISDSGFGEVWDSTVKLLMADNIQIRYWCIIENVRSPEGSTDILSHVRMRGLTTKETEDLWNHSMSIQYRYPFFGNAGIGIIDVQTLLEKTTEEPVVVGEGPFDLDDSRSQFENVQSSFESVCTSIRLIHPEPILMSPIYVDAADVWGSSVGYGVREPAIIRPGKRCELSGADLQDMQELLKVVSRGESGLSRAINVCLRRIGFANTRYSLEDKLLDTVMALEALVLSDSGDPSERGEQSFRLAIRLARFLRDKKDDQITVYKTVRKAYRLRNKVVHGDKLEPSDTSLITDLDTLAREATRRFLLAKANGQEVNWHALLFE